MRHIWPLAIFLFWSIAAAQAARLKSTIEGQVTDNSGAALPGVTITVNAAEGCCECTCRDDAGDYYCCSDDSKLCCGERSQVTDASGSFVIRNLPVGAYDVKAHLEGFAVKTTKVMVSAGAAAQVKIVLDASVTEMITVTGTVAVVDSQAEEGKVTLILAAAGCCDCKCKKSGDYYCCNNDHALCCSPMSADVPVTGKFALEIDSTKIKKGQTYVLYHTRIDSTTRILANVVFDQNTESIGVIHVPADAVKSTTRMQLRKQ